MRKIVTLTLLASLAAMNFMPLAAVAKDKTNTSAPKQFKSMVKKNKKVSDEYKYAYVNMDWWSGFNDPILSGYINQAVRNNYDLKMATLNVEEYYQNVKLQFANELPMAGVGASPALTKMPGKTNTNMFFVAPAFVNYELDIFLKNHDKTKSVKKLYEGSKLDERAAYIAIASSVGTVYLNIVKLDKTIELQEEIVAGI